MARGAATGLSGGALGTLGVLDISLKILPVPAAEIPLPMECSQEQTIATMNRWAGKPLPLSAACCDGNQLRFRPQVRPKAWLPERER